MLLLASLRDGALHGYALMEQLRERSGGTFALAEGTVYPALHRLEREGSVTSRWAPKTGRRRRIYQLTPAGERALAERRESWSQFARSVELVLEGAS